MIIIFGWLKETKPVKPLLDCYCYVCQRKSSWELWRETEWVTFFGMRTLPFLSKDSLACSRCGDETPLERSRSQRLQRGGAAPSEAAAFLEGHQLSGKSEVQRNFLLSVRAERESQEATNTRGLHA
jgi:hypothetical protein